MTESRWTTDFKNHPFQAPWSQLKTEVSQLQADDPTVEATVIEVVRLKRVVNFLDIVIANVDPDLTPRSIWVSFQNQCVVCQQQLASYLTTRDITHLRNVNDHADLLLSYVRPFEVLPEKALSALAGASQTYATELNALVDAFRSNAMLVLSQLEGDKSAAAQDRRTVDSQRKKIESYFAELFTSTEGKDSVEAQIDRLLAGAKANSKAIEDLHSILLVGTPENLSLQARVKTAQVESESVRDKLNSLLDGAKNEVRELSAFHESIFGKKDGTGAHIGGLESELKARQTQLKKLEDEQAGKHAAMFQRIESLLPGATSAGLASSYKLLKDQFTAPIQRYTKLFYGSLGLLVLAAVLMAVDSFSLSPFTLKLVEVKEWDLILRALIYKAPFVAPVVWLAIFSSTRRSQYERLQQEYAHKEALASSYESYRTQLDALQSEGDSLRRELLAKAIDAIAYNASVTLDGKHQEKMPFQQLFESLSVEEIKKLVELAKQVKAT